MTKFVVSTTLNKPEWNNSTVIHGDVAAQVGKLKEQFANDIVVHGSAQLVNTLKEHNLVDEIVFLQRVHELRAAVDDDVVGELLLELADLCCDIAMDDRRVVPFGLVQGRRHHELGHAVDLVGLL